ncbi:MAG: LamG domain-containing protein [Candidatus Woesearchaeota archaeon]|nr:LamG domain-containing protein [Candidatus Woesearchaeota archaeon]
MRSAVLVGCIVLLFIFVSQQATAAYFGCEFRSTACLANETRLVYVNSSEATTPNNTHAQLANFSGDTYEWRVCCSTDAFRTMESSCLGNGIAIVNLEENTSSHVEAGNMSNYVYKACLNVTSGTVACEYPTGSCSGGYSEVASIASSETADANLTNTHVAEPGYFDRQVCCQIGGQNAPVVAWVNLSPINSTTRDDLFCLNGTTTDADGDSVTLHYNWYRNQTSITVLNLPMDNDGGITHDISGFGNDGTAMNTTTFLPTGGQVGGGFDLGEYGHIEVGTDPTLNLSNAFTIVAWVRPTTVSNTHAIVGSQDGYLFQLQSAEFQFWPNVDEATIHSSAISYTANSWLHVAVSYDYGTGAYAFYLNSSQVGSGTAARTANDPTVIRVGSYRASSPRYFNGTIDEVIIFNRTLSATEITTLYNHNNQYFNGTDIERNDIWNCSITPVDSTGLDGATVYSNQTVVSGSLPLVPTLIYPLNGNTSVFERVIDFNWTTSDERDGDTVTYNFNLTIEAGACSIETEQTGISDSNYTDGPLCVDQVYSWNVTACDDQEGCNSVSTTFNFTIASVCAMTLINNNTDFGDLSLNQEITTDDYTVQPFLLENTGNVHLNVTLNATGGPLYSSVGLNNDAFSFKAEENESTAMNVSGSQTTYTPVPNTFTLVIKQLNYTDTADVAAIHINLTVPGDEPPGAKETDIVFSGVAS